MGEVYRADDLELGQSVALKFLPERLASDPAALERFRGEVRLARQVSHPNVCRVYDLGQVAGQYFLSMEYVDGEDLGLLLKRIGRFPGDRAVELARQLCLGLAAAHEKGVLHRDLKPANVMVDGRGKALITDFGLAGFAEEVSGVGVRSGTPAYMAPEQLAGREISTQSDLYSLGLVLHELFTGQPIWQADSFAELVEKRSQSTAHGSSTSSGDIDPAVEMAIQRCLEEDPKNRPASAVAVAMSLPGGDPLAAAVAAGETPSPAMVAEAGSTSGLRPTLAVACLVGFVALVIGVNAIRPPTLVELVSLSVPPEVLRVRAQDIARELGYREIPDYVASGFVKNSDYVRFLADNASESRWDALQDERPSGIHFWQRWSPVALTPSNVHKSVVELNDPPQVVPGSFTVQLDKKGRLFRFSAVFGDSASDAEVDSTQSFDWNVPLRLAGLESEALRSKEARTGVFTAADVAMTWEGVYPDSGHPIVVEAESRHGRMVRFWISEGPSEDSAVDSEERSSPHLVGALFMFGVFAATVLLARRNLLQGRGDRRGALRLAGFIFLTYWCVDGVLLSPHVAGGDVAGAIAAACMGQPVGHAFIHAFVTWAGYLALEPFVRRLWPTVMVSWARLLEGRWRDPRVGRDILMGGLMGAATHALDPVAAIVQEFLGVPLSQPLCASKGSIWALDGSMLAFGFLARAGGSVFGVVMVLLVLLFVKVLVRKTWIAALVPIALFGTFANVAQSLHPVMTVVVGCIGSALMVVVLLRFGFVAALFGFFAGQLMDQNPLSLTLGDWSTRGGLVVFAVLTAMMVGAFYTALAGRPVFRGLAAD